MLSISTSSARIKHRMLSISLMVSIHGLMIKATMTIEKGSPCGMPHLLMKGLPTPPAKQLKTLRFSKWLRYAVRTGCGMPAAFATWYTSSLLTWSKNFAMSAVPPQKCMSSSFSSSMVPRTSIQASTAPLSGMPTCISGRAHDLTHGSICRSLVLAHAL